MFQDHIMFRGRAEEMSVAVKFLRAHSSVDVVGEQLSGRTSFLAEMSRRLDALGIDSIHVAGVHSLRAQALGALASTGASPQNGAAATVARAVEAFSRRFNHDRSVILADDWHHIDELSRGIIESVSVQRNIPIVRTRLREPLRWQTSPVSRQAEPSPRLVLELQAAPFADLDLILRDRLGGAVETVTMARIFSKSGGNIGIALKLAESALAHGHLVLGDSGWRATHDLWSPSLQGIVEGLISSLSPAAQRALGKLSLSGSRELTELSELAGWDELEELEAHSFLKLYEAEHRHLITIAPPLVVEYFRQLPTGLRKVREESPTTSTLPGASRALPYAVRNVGRSDPEQNAIFSRVVRERETDRAYAAAAAWEREATSETCVTYVRSLVAMDAPQHHVEAVLFAPTALGGYAAQGELIKLRAQWRAHVSGDLAGALSELESRREELGDHGRLVDAYSVALQSFFGVVPENLESVLTVTPELPGFVADTLRRTLAAVLAITGEHARARTVFEQYLATASPPRAPDTRDPLLSIVLFTQGHTAGAYALSREGLDQAKSCLDIDGCRAHAAVLTWILLSDGRYDELDDILAMITTAGGSPRLLIELSTQVALEVGAAILATQHGHDETAKTHLSNAKAFGVTGPLPLQSPLWATSFSLARQDESGHGADLLWAESQRLWDRGARFAAVLGMLHASELNLTDSRLEHTTTAVRSIDTPFLRAHLDYLQFLQHGSGNPEEIGDRLIETRQARLALSIYHAAAERAHEELDPERAQRLSARAARFAESHPKVVSGQNSRIRRSSLTRRETQVARLIASGRTNPDIAEELTLSIRTVETHVHRIIKKTHAKTRLDIAEYV